MNRFVQLQKPVFNQMIVIAKAKPYIPPKDLERVIHAFITSRSNYGNFLNFGKDHLLTGF